VKLKTNKEFSQVYKTGKKWHSKGVVVFYKEGLEKKVGFTASKKVGNAVKRNFAKRRMRALFFELEQTLKGGTYVFVAKDQIYHMLYEDLKRDFRWSLKKLKCLE
jgi:ribonuclease P protein component